jgi:uncharacterized cupredoxin-like copper-binding protein
MSKTPDAEQAPGLKVVFKGLELEAEETVAPTGAVRVVVINEASLPHDFLIVRTDLPVDRLPLSNGHVEESAVDVVGRIPEVKPGGEGEVAVWLEPGRHLLLCNEPGHYERTAGLELTVQPAHGR